MNSLPGTLGGTESSMEWDKRHLVPTFTNHAYMAVPIRVVSTNCSVESSIWRPSRPLAW